MQKLGNVPRTGAGQENSSYHPRVPVVAELGDSVSSQLPEVSGTVLAPVGSTEQHGPHLPLDTDTRIAVAVARSAAARLAGEPGQQSRRQQWLVAPAIAYGASGEHQGFAGTISIGTEALAMLLVEYGRSAGCWARRLVFVNGHGGNTAALKSAVSTLRSEGRDAVWCSCTVAGGDAHAGHTETSILLHLAPASVRTECWRPGNTTPLSELISAMRRGGIAVVSELGVLGNPTTATVDEGERLIGEMVDGCVRRISDWAPDGDGMLT